MMRFYGFNQNSERSINPKQILLNLLGNNIFSHWTSTYIYLYNNRIIITSILQEFPDL